MVKLPSWPQEWNDQSADTPQENSRPGPDLNSGPERNLDGWQSPGWSLENSGLGFSSQPSRKSISAMGRDRMRRRPWPRKHLRMRKLLRLPIGPPGTIRFIFLTIWAAWRNPWAGSSTKKREEVWS
jgi:hypothetical protein